MNRASRVGRAVLGVLLAGGLLGGTACTSSSGPEPTGEPSAPAATSSAPTASPSVAEDAFGFDDVAEFENGLTVELAGLPLARRAGDHEQGAESTNGELVVVAVLITNDSGEEFAAQDAGVTLQYEGVESAPVITDEVGDLRPGFGEPIAAGADDTATVGFAVPFGAATAIAITVDPGDGLNEPVTFVGGAEHEDG